MRAHEQVLIHWLCLVACIFGCSKRHDHGPAKQRLGASSNGNSPATNCAEKNDDTSSHYVGIDVAGHKRRFYLVLPKAPGKIQHLIIGFHGRGQSGEQAANTWALEAEGAPPYVAMFPDGTPQPWFHNRIGWDTRSEASPELPLFDALVDWAVTHYCIDRSRVHVLGHSWGAGMANLVACARANVRTLVSVAGGGPTFPCQGPVAAVIVHGRADRDEPLAAGQLAQLTWSFYNRCGTNLVASPLEGCVAYGDCLKGKPLLWCEHGGAHGWPDLLRDGKLLNWLLRP